MKYFKLYEELRNAIISRNAERLRELTKGGRGLLIKGNNGNTVIHLAALILNEDICNVIFQSINEKINSKTESEKARIIKFFKKNLRNKFGKSPVHLAIETSNFIFLNHIEYNTCFLLEIRDNFGNLPIHYACKFGNLEIIKLILRLNSNVEAENFEGNTPLHIAARHGKKKTVEFLLTLGVSLDKENRYGLTPKGMAKFYGHEEIVRILENHESIERT